MARKVVIEMIGGVPDYILNEEIYVMSLDLRTVTLPCFLVIIFIVPQAFIFIILMKKGLKKLKKTARFSESTLKMQRNFLNAVYIQVSVYMASIQLPIAYFFVSVMFKIHCQFANNMGFVVFSFNGLSSTIVMIWIHKPYRDYCIKILKIQKTTPKVDPQETIVSVATNVV
uniref:G_PROTEIN_RECEP_F1_2 domain-containing protein n=1 Tax=Caenorhabditis tropicalis TaxID=1561998 RepID=A0A1I7T4V4_9PELO